MKLTDNGQYLVVKRLKQANGQPSNVLEQVSRPLQADMDRLLETLHLMRGVHDTSELLVVKVMISLQP